MRRKWNDLTLVMLLCFSSFLQQLELARGNIYVFVLHRHELFGNIFVRVDETNKLADVNVVMFLSTTFFEFLPGSFTAAATHIFVPAA